MELLFVSPQHMTPTNPTFCTKLQDGWIWLGKHYATKRYYRSTCHAKKPYSGKNHPFHTYTNSYLYALMTDIWEVFSGHNFCDRLSQTRDSICSHRLGFGSWHLRNWCSGYTFLACSKQKRKVYWFETSSDQRNTIPSRHSICIGKQVYGDFSASATGAVDIYMFDFCHLLSSILVWVFMLLIQTLHFRWELKSIKRCT